MEDSQNPAPIPEVQGTTCGPVVKTFASGDKVPLWLGIGCLKSSIYVYKKNLAPEACNGGSDSPLLGFSSTCSYSTGPTFNP